jgi:predicted RNA-binding Zn ribbon-like protein
MTADLAILAEFLNTVDERRFGSHAETHDSTRDALQNPTGLRLWLTSRGLLAPHATVSAAELELALELRNGLREQLGPDGQTVRDTRLADVARQIPLGVRFDTGEPRLVHEGAPAHRALAALLDGAVIAAARGEWPRLKLCAADDCRWAFYDSSRNRLGRWCSMNVCGNREKTRRYRGRRR